jgi:hypothetical protein
MSTFSITAASILHAAILKLFVDFLGNLSCLMQLSVAAWLTGLGATGPTCVQLSALQLHSLLWKGLLGALLLWHCGLTGRHA